MTATVGSGKSDSLLTITDRANAERRSPDDLAVIESETDPFGWNETFALTPPTLDIGMGGGCRRRRWHGLVLQCSGIEEVPARIELAPEVMSAPLYH